MKLKIFIAATFVVCLVHSLFAVENLALKSVATASANSAGAKNCVTADPKIPNFGWGGCTKKNPIWLQVDFGEKREVGAIVTRWMKPPVAYVVSVSNDGENFKEVGKVDAKDRAMEQGQGFGFPTEFVRYVRITITKSSAATGEGFTMSRFEIYPF